MNRRIMGLLLLLTIVALLVSACGSQSGAGLQPASAQEAEPEPGPESNKSDADQAPAVAQAQAGGEAAQGQEARGDAGEGQKPAGLAPSPGGEGQASVAQPALDSVSANTGSASAVAEGPEHVAASGSSQAAAPVMVTGNEAEPEDIPSLEERNAMLDRVNLGGPAIVKDGQAPGEGPAPGTESGPAPGESQGDILDGVNLAPEAEKDGLVGDGPAPGTESGPAPGETRDDILDKVNPEGPGLSGSEATEVEAEAAGTASVPEAVVQFIETLANWLRDLFSPSGG